MKLLASAVSCLLAVWSGAAVARCPLPAGWQHIVSKRTHYVVFGEMHGSAESPARFGDAACALAERHERLLVAVELDANAALRRAWSAPDAGFPAALLAEMPEWRTRDDGVSSRAMFAMLIRLHTLKAADCGPHHTGADVAWRGPPRIVAAHGAAGPVNPDGAFDATFFIGHVAASPPAARP